MQCARAVRLRCVPCFHVTNDRLCPDGVPSVSGWGNNWSENVADAVNAMAQEIAEIRKFQQECERDKEIGALMQLNEKLMTQATNYTNLVMLAGYAGFFGLWSSLVGRLPDWLYAVSGLLALLSLFLFVSWEIIKMVWGSLHMRRTNDMITKPVRGAKPLDLFIAASSLHGVRVHKVWLWFLIPTVAFGIAAALLLVGFFAIQVWQSLNLV